MSTIAIPDTSSENAGSVRSAYLAEPVAVSDRPGPWPGVVMLHDSLGLGDDMREQADWLAAAGYLTLMPDLYNGRPMVRCIKGAVSQMFRQRGPIYDQVEAARTYLAAQPNCTGKVGVIGYCLGGGFALVVAGRPGWAAASVNYGPLPNNLDEVLAGSCPMVASFGARDRTLRGAAVKVRRALDVAGVPSDVQEYPNARHAFINRSTLRSPLTVVAKIAGVGYDHDSAADAKRRILEFFDKHLRVPAERH
jgi:carboxymethylenebutenolidase